MSATCVYELPRPVWITYDVLGQRFKTVIGPVRAEIVMPQLTSDAGLAGKPDLRDVPDAALEPSQGESPVHLDLYPPSADAIEPAWCTEFAANHPGRATALRTVGLELLGADRSLDGLTAYSQLSDQLVDVAHRCLEGWFQGFAEWVSVLTGQDLNHHHQLYASSAIAPGFRAWKGGKWHQGSLTFEIPNVTPIAPDDLREVFTRVGAGERPALEWQLMLSGSSAHDRGYHRTAVADFATAVEVCLTRLVRNSTSTAPRPGDRSTLPKWSEWLTAHEKRTYTEPSLFKDLVDLRNDVLHRGVDPSYEQARGAYTCALSMVRDYGSPSAPWRPRP